MKKILIIISSILLIGLLIFFIIKNSTNDKPFNIVPVTQYNLVYNASQILFYDTILHIGLNQTGIKDVNIYVNKLTDASKNQFNGDLKAHIRYHEGSFYLFIDDLDRVEAIRVIAHEIIHMNQYLNKELIYENNVLIWKNEEFILSNIPYEERPWERDAYEKEKGLYNNIYGVLYEK